jgi:tellurite methyltransferase
VIRAITGFHLDDDGDWVAEMSCHHNRHVRHQPPFKEAPWVLTPEGRSAHIGSPIECSLCDRA